jgi:hypothetical protein
VHRLDDRVLRVEAGEERRADQRQRADQRRDPRDRHVLLQAAHVADVLVVVHADDHGAGGEEEQRLEERVRHQVEHRDRVRRGAERDRHVAELRQRRVGDDALDVVLDDAEKAHEERRDRADDEDHRQRRVGELEQRRHPRDHEDAGGHHRRRVDQRGDRRRAFHRVGQPDVERELRALAHRADEEADADDGDEAPVARRERELRQVAALGEGLAVVERAGERDDQADAEDEAEVADPVDDERLHVGEDRRRPREPEADQQVRDQADRLPAEEELQEVVAHDEHEHREREQRDVAEEALVARVVGHVADRVDVHHQRDEGDDGHHHRRQAVDQEADLHLERADAHPLVDGRVEARAVDGDGIENPGRDQERDQDAEDRHRVRAGAADLLAEQAGDDRADERRHRHDGEKRGRERGGHGQRALSP